jgi:hypothetical protein
MLGISLVDQERESQGERIDRAKKRLWVMRRGERLCTVRLCVRPSTAR